MTHLPVSDFRQQILDTVKDSQVTIIEAETGAGKTTQVPQYLYQAGYKVNVTQPRRVAARNMAKRVAHETNTKLGELVGYKTGESSEFNRKTTQILYMTDRIQMIRQVMDRPSPANEILVIDEVHQWNENIEVMVAWAKRKTQVDSNFKVVVMSATMDSRGLSEYFGNAPVIKVPGRLYPVKREMFHEGALKKTREMVLLGKNTLVFQPGVKECESFRDNLTLLLGEDACRVKIFTLSGEMSATMQDKCFENYEGFIKVIVATNVAQTSLTIDDIDVVVDTCTEKVMNYRKGTPSLEISTISRADALQRAGRAGRVKDGLYFHEVPLDSMEEYPTPDIQRMDIDTVVLALKNFKVDIENLELFHPIGREKILQSKKNLQMMECLDSDGEVTGVGKFVAELGLSVRYGRLVAEGFVRGCLESAILAAAIMETGQLYTMHPEAPTIWRSRIDPDHTSDIVTALRVFKFYHDEMGENKEIMKDEGISLKSWFAVKTLVRNISSIVKKKLDLMVVTDTAGEEVDEQLKICLFASNIDRIFRSAGYSRMFSKVDEEGVLGSTFELSNRSMIRPNQVGGTLILTGVPIKISFKARNGGIGVREIISNATSMSLERFYELFPKYFEDVFISRATVSVDDDGEVYLIYDTELAPTSTNFMGGTSNFKIHNQKEHFYPSQTSERINALKGMLAQYVLRGHPEFKTLTDSVVSEKCLKVGEWLDSGGFLEWGKAWSEHPYELFERWDRPVENKTLGTESINKLMEKFGSR